jgi:hypothetical protein
MRPIIFGTHTDHDKSSAAPPRKTASAAAV